MNWNFKKSRILLKYIEVKKGQYNLFEVQISQAVSCMRDFVGCSCLFKEITALWLCKYVRYFSIFNMYMSRVKLRKYVNSTVFIVVVYTKETYIYIFHMDILCKFLFFKSCMFELCNVFIFSSLLDIFWFVEIHIANDF